MIIFLGQPVLQVEATDMDRDADLEYDIVDPITARDKTGNILTNRAAYDFGAAFAIDPNLDKFLYKNLCLIHQLQ